MMWLRAAVDEGAVAVMVGMVSSIGWRLAGCFGGGLWIVSMVPWNFRKIFG